MGEVFRATDTALGREVALKLLPKAFAADPDRLARFDREARLLAALNHSNIAHVYGFESATLADGSGVHFLAMELVSGEDLAERLKRGPLPIDEAIAIARQIAEALEEAHEKGIVHRDLKPANVKLTPDGRVKVLDFGLAKAWAGPGAGGTSSADLSESPTLAHTGTQAGLILGTAAYMSPEQARGKPVDKRADIWAFGVVVYEMLTGQRLFGGETVTDVLAAVVRQEIAWDALPAATPVSVRRLLTRCLERDQRQRLHDIADARLELTDLRAETAPQPRPEQAPRARWTLGLAVAGLVGWAATAFVLWPTPPKPVPLVRFEIPPVASTTLALAERSVLDVAADGRRIVFAARRDEVRRLYLRDRSDVEPRPIPGTDGASNPVFSPDGTSIAFFAGNVLKVATLDGGVSTLAPVRVDSRGLTWAGRDRIIFAPNAAGHLLAVSATGGATSAVSTLTRGERTHRWPHALPGAEAVLFTVGTYTSPDSYDDSRIEAVVLATGERRVVLAGARMARFVPSTGHLLFARGSTVHVVRFDPRKLTTKGEPVPLLRDVDGDTTTGASHFACAGDGTFVYVPGTSQAGLRKLAWVSRDGTIEDIPVPAALYNDLRIAPDGQRFAVVHGNSGLADIWVYDLARGTFTRFTFDGRSATPTWSADSRTLYYASFEQNDVRTAVLRKPADGSREAERVAFLEGRAYLSDLEDGARSVLVSLYGEQTTGSNFGIYRLPLAPQGDQQQKATPIVDLPAFEEYGARLSPDHSYFAFQSNATGMEEVYVRDLTGTGAQWQVTTTGGEEPNWSADGRELFYRDDQRLMVVNVETRGTFAAGTAKMLLDGIYNLRSDSGISYEVAPKGDRLLIIRPVDAGAATARVRVVLNMFDEMVRATAKDAGSAR